MTPEDFKKDGNLRAALAEVLKNPTLQTAIAVVKQASEPEAGPYDQNPVVKTALYDQRAGVNRFLKALDALTEAPVERKPLTQKQLAKTAADIP